MSRPHLITGLDIGNAAVKAVVVGIDPVSGRAQVVGTGIAPSNGMRRGMVVDVEETAHDVAQVVAQAGQAAGTKVHRVYASINGLYLRMQTSRGVIAVSRADNEISQADVQRVIQAASAVSLPANREILHIMPRFFVVDGHDQVKNPIDMSGVRLEAEVLIVDVLSPYIKNLARCITMNGLEVAEFVFTPLAAARAVLNKKAREHGAMVLDVGGGLCSMAVFEEGDLSYAGVLPVGSRHITNDLAIVLRTSLDTAEQIKLEYGAIGAASVSKKETIDLSAFIGDEESMVSRKRIAEVVEARAHEFLDMVTKELKRTGKYLLPGGVILTGGGIKLPGFAKLVKETLRLPVHIGVAHDVDGLVGQVDNSIFATAIGLALWGTDKEFDGARRSHVFEGFKNFGFMKKLREWLGDFLP